MIGLCCVGFSYDGEHPVLEDVSLDLMPGERTVLLGLNGSGKSTLARMLNGALLPAHGTVTVDGIVSGPATARELARRVGYVRQDPRNQIVSALVSDEVSFGPRNLGLAREEVLARVDEALAACGISELSDRMTTELSGGQQQLLALAGVLALHPSYLVLDEAGSQLDGASRTRLRATVGRLVERGVGVLEIAHGAQATFGADRVLVLSGGRMGWEGTAQGFFESEGALAAAGLADDPLARLLSEATRRGYALGQQPDPEGLAAFLGPESISARREAVGEPCPTDRTHEISLSQVTVGYGDVRALDEVSLAAPSGLTLVLGRPGSGKTTAARVLAGVLEPDAGRALLDEKPVRAGGVGLTFQRPEDQLFADTVLADIAFGPLAAGRTSQEAERDAHAAAVRLGVGKELLGRSPFELSGGQMRRVALAGVIAAEPVAYVFDEPTAGLDAPARRLLHDLIRNLTSRGASVLVISHDAGEWLDEATRVVFVRDARVVRTVPPEALFETPEIFEEAGLEVPFEVRLRAAREGRDHA